jgi:hypothetical protein
MRRLRKTCLVTLLLDSSSFQFGRFIAAQSPQAPQQWQDTSGAKAQAAEKEKLEAEFYIVAVPGAKRFAQVTGARFIRGAEKLRPMAAALKGAKYPMIFPDKTVTKLFRRGTLTCQPNNGECSFVLLSPE